MVAKVSQLRVMAVGGGGGGPNGHSGGAGSGYVRVATVDVKQGDVFAVVVGGGGKGGDQSQNTNLIIGNTNGGTSKFGETVVADGGKSVYPIAGQWQDAFNENGGDGGSGGGAAGYLCVQGIGGSEGNNGPACGSNDVGGNPPLGEGGHGQGNYMSSLTIFKDENWFSAGEGGLNIASAVAGTWVPGGGAGGIMLNGYGPEAENGASTTSGGEGGKGGKGYGAGGGGGGWTEHSIKNAGGNGANGLVYVQWD